MLLSLAKLIDIYSQNRRKAKQNDLLLYLTWQCRCELRPLLSTFAKCCLFGFFSLMSADLIKVNTFMLPSITDQLYLSKKKKVLKEQTKEEAFIEAVIYHQCL